MPIRKTYTVTVHTEQIITPGLNDPDDLTPDKALAKALEPFDYIPAIKITEARVVRRG